MQERLQKLISRSGVASRRKAEELIKQGLVSLNGEIVSELGTKADPERDAIRVQGKRIFGKPGRPVYLMLNKPRGYISSTEDPEGRRKVTDLLGRFRSKVYPVGRLDYNSEGLLLLTNDGDFANRVLSAKSEIPKTYRVKVTRRLSDEQLERFAAGLNIEGRPTAPAKIRLVKPAENPWYEVTLIEGRNRQLHKMFQRLGCLVEKIKRMRIGPLKLAELPPGQFRELTADEVARLSSPRSRKQPDAKRRTDRPTPKKHADDRRRRPQR